MIRRFPGMKWCFCVFLLAASCGVHGQAQGHEGHRWWNASLRQKQVKLEADLLRASSSEKIREDHDLFCDEPHVAGTPGDHRIIKELASSFEEMGLEPELQELHLYLPLPVEAHLSIVRGPGESGPHPGDPPVELVLQEAAVKGDPYSRHPDLTFGWNAYSGNGDVTAEVVYANRGTKEDFSRLASLGISVKGRIVIARYGGNYRGYKAKFAEEAGAAGLIIYTDPKGSGYRAGLTYPEGGYANDTYIQRGSIKTLPYQGDPLTPFEPSTENAKRLDPDSTGLPTIPVQPIGYRAAGEIISRMRGKLAPRDWHGALPFTYHLTGGPELRVRLKVVQERKIRRTANVLATMRGSKYPDQKVIIGCHFDAWTFGAGDPNAGTIVLYEAARLLMAARKQGHVFERSIVFANWAAEEQGIIGSTEYCEANRDDLVANALCYLNLDMAAMGTNFGSSSSPLLKSVIADTTGVVPQAGKLGVMVQEPWLRGQSTPRFGNLGGGSDHVGFYCHLGIPSASMGAGGSAGVSYHSNYENLAWYRKIVGDDYEPAVMVSRLVAVAGSRLSNATLLPFDPTQVPRDLSTHLSALQNRADGVGLAWPEKEAGVFSDAIVALQEASQKFLESGLQALQLDQLDAESTALMNDALMKLPRAFCLDEGLPERPWYRSFFASSDPDSGYSAWMLPALRYQVEKGNRAGLARELLRHGAMVSRLSESLTRVQAATAQKMSKN